jgi:hypothetical protein
MTKRGDIFMKNRLWHRILPLIYLILFLANMAVAEEAVLNTQELKSNPSATVVEEKTQSSKVVVIGNRDTKRYHLQGMRYYNKVKKYHRIYFNSEQEAIDNGYYKAGTGKDLTGAMPEKEDTLETQVTTAAPAEDPPIIFESNEKITIQEQDKALETKVSKNSRR